MNFSEMIKQTGEATKSKMNKVLDDMKSTMEKKTTSGVSHSMEMGEEFSEHKLKNLRFLKLLLKKGQVK